MPSYGEMLDLVFQERASHSSLRRKSPSFVCRRPATPAYINVESRKEKGDRLPYRIQKYCAATSKLHAPPPFSQCRLPSTVFQACSIDLRV